MPIQSLTWPIHPAVRRMRDVPSTHGEAQLDSFMLTNTPASSRSIVDKTTQASLDGTSTAQDTTTPLPSSVTPHQPLLHHPPAQLANSWSTESANALLDRPESTDTAKPDQPASQLKASQQLVFAPVHSVRELPPLVLVVRLLQDA